MTIWRHEESLKTITHELIHGFAWDFNAFPVSAEAWRMAGPLRPAWRPWRDGWLPTFSLRAVGWPAGWVQIDQIHHSRGWTSAGCWAASPGASDHRAVIADLIPGDGKAKD